MSECYCSAVFTDVNDESALCGACALRAYKQLMEVTRERDELRRERDEARHELSETRAELEWVRKEFARLKSWANESNCY